MFIDSIFDKLLGSKYKEARRIMKNADQTAQVIGEAANRAKNSKGGKRYINDLRLLGQMLNDYFNKRYTLLSKSTIIIAVAALLYIISPLDIIPESIPFVGSLDDIAVLAYAIRAISEELKTYKVWLATKDMREDEAITLINRVVQNEDRKKNEDVPK